MAHKRLLTGIAVLQIVFLSLPFMASSAQVASGTPVETKNQARGNLIYNPGFEIGHVPENGSRHDVSELSEARYVAACRAIPGWGRGTTSSGSACLESHPDNVQSGHRSARLSADGTTGDSAQVNSRRFRIRDTDLLQLDFYVKPDVGTLGALSVRVFYWDARNKPLATTVVSRQAPLGTGWQLMSFSPIEVAVPAGAETGVLQLANENAFMFPLTLYFDAVQLRKQGEAID